MASDNEINLRTNRGEYVGGDTVYGVVYLKLSKPVQSRTLKLVIRGYEKTEFSYSYVVPTSGDQYEARKGTRAGKNVFLSEDMRMLEYPGGFPMGLHAFPFQYQLPHGLPGSCVIKNEDQISDDSYYEGLITYTIGAALVNPVPRPKLQVEVPLVVYDNLDCRNSNLSPDPRRANGLVRTFFCLNRGKIMASTKLDKSSYCNDEVIKIDLEIINDSSVDVLGATITLKRVLKLLGKADSEEDLLDYTSLETVLSKEHEGCTRGNRLSWSESLKLTERESTAILVPPSTSGKLVKCSYFIDLEIHCPWAPDIDVNQPLLIKAPPNINWEEWSTPDWVNRCTTGSVTFPLAVGRDLLVSESFSGIPGLSHS